jgi:hypothetical protein
MAANGTNSFAAQSIDHYKSMIESEDVSSIPGRPNANSLIKMLNELAAGARGIECGYSQFGFLYLVIPQQIYQHLTNENVVPPADPGITPAYQPNGDPAANHTILLNWQFLRGQYDKHKNIDKALIAVAKSKLSPETRQALQILFIGGNTGTFHDYFDRLWQRYGQCTPADIERNANTMKTPWDPATEDWAKVVTQIQNGALMAYFCNQPFQEHQLVHIAETIIHNTGVMGLQYQEWRSKPPADRTFDNLVTFMTEKYNLWLETGTPAAQQGYGMNAEGSVAASEEAEAAFAESMNAFGDVNRHNANTFQNLSGANSQLINSVMPAIQQLQQQVQGLAMAARAQPPITHTAGQVPYQAPPTPAMFQAPQQPMQYAHQPPAQVPYLAPYQAPYQQQMGYQGRGGGRRGGRGNNYRNRGGQQQIFQGQQFPSQQFGQMMNQHLGQLQQANPPNNLKHYHNWNYCWTHGCDLPDWHNSMTCRNKTAGHMDYATRENKMGGSMKANHKTVFKPRFT